MKSNKSTNRVVRTSGFILAGLFSIMLLPGADVNGQTMRQERRQDRREERRDDRRDARQEGYQDGLREGGEDARNRRRCGIL